MADFLNSKILANRVTQGGLLIGRMVPVRASTVPDYGIPPYPGEGEGFADVWPEVLDWPFAVDDAGIPFDQANLYGVRNVCYRRPLVDGGGDNYKGLTPVPRQLPVGYTASIRREFDYNPYSTQRRTAGGIGSPSVPVEDGWLPGGLDANYAATLEADVAFMSYVPVTGSPYDNWLVGGGGFGTGWRGMVWDFIVGYSGGLGFPITVTLTIAADADPANPWDAYTGANLPTVLFSITRSSDPLGFGIAYSGTFGNLFAPTFGKPCGFYVLMSLQGGIFSGRVGYRTDIPLCATATYQNKVAPGGYAP